MQTTPLVSIIIAHYNLAAYVGEAVLSCLNQTYKNIEIIVVDDVSTDSIARATIRTLGKKYPGVRVIENSVNQGSAKTYNAGIAEAKGLYCCCLDADDVLEESYIEKIVSLFLHNPQIGFATSWQRVFGESSAILKVPPYDVPALLIRNLFSAASVFSKKAWKQVGGFDPSMKTYRDWDFWLSLVEAGYEWSVVGEPLIGYRDRKGSASKLTVEKNVLFVKKILTKHEDLYKKYSTDVIGELYEMVVQLNADFSTLQRSAAILVDTPGWKFLEKLRSIKRKLGGG